MTLGDELRAAWRRRQALHEDPEIEAYRLFHGYSEGQPGLEIDRYGPIAILNSKGADPELFPEACKVLLELHDFEAVIAKVRGKSPEALHGEIPAASYPVREYGVRYLTEAHQLNNPGLYLDARPARKWLAENSEGRRILNLFSYAGSLGVAAMSGGARSVTHVDSQKRALERCRENHELNGQTIDERDLMRANIYQKMRKSKTQRRKYGGIILDPPPIKRLSNAKSDRTPGAKGIFGLIPAVSKMLEKEGWLLCFFHHDERSWDELEREVQAAAGSGLEPMWRSTSGPDFPEEDERRVLRLSAFRCVSPC